MKDGDPPLAQKLPISYLKKSCFEQREFCFA